MKPILVIQNCQIESAGTIIDYLGERALPYQVVHLYNNHSLPQLESVEAVISLGCPHSVTIYKDYDYLKELYQYISKIVREDKPYLGLCFGGQLLAKVLGAKVEPNSVKEIGNYQLKLTEAGISDPLFDGLPNEFEVFHWHGDTFKIPFGCENLAETDDCKNQAFRKGKAIGLQFHLEAKADEVPKWCDEYSNELNKVKKSKSQIISAYNLIAEKTKQLNYKLLDNFIKSF